MKNSTLLSCDFNPKMMVIVLTVMTSLITQFANAQDYRTIEAYMDDFGKNEMFVKKALIDYSATIVESQLDSRSEATSGKIVDKLININTIVKKTNKGFNGNTLLRNSFVKMNEKTIESLKNGSLILNDYVYQSNLPFEQINLNMAQKEKDMQSYYQEVKNFDRDKRVFGSQFNVGFKASGKNVLEYNAYQNLLFYKMNVIDQKLTALINTKDKAAVAKCFALIEAYRNEVIAKTSEYQGAFKDNSLNNANVKYANFIYAQKATLAGLFDAYADESKKLAAMKASNQPETAAFVQTYNQQVRAFNEKKNALYAEFDKIQSAKKSMHDGWFVVNGKFLQANSEFENIHERYILPEGEVATR